MVRLALRADDLDLALMSSLGGRATSPGCGNRPRVQNRSLGEALAASAQNHAGTAFFTASAVHGQA